MEGSISPIKPSAEEQAKWDDILSQEGNGVIGADENAVPSGDALSIGDPEAAIERDKQIAQEEASEREAGFDSPQAK